MGHSNVDVFVARQPIFDAHQNVYGYELLYRSGSSNEYEETDGNKASLGVIRKAFLTLGPQAVTGRKKAFINFTRDLLVSGVAASLPHDHTVIEILEDIQPDETTLTACRELKKAGFMLALDDYTLTNVTQESFLELADIVKVDFKLTPEQDRWNIVQLLSGRPKQLLAEKVETRQEFNGAVEKGYALFQGYFFSKPVLISGKDIPTIKLNYIQVLQEVNRRELDFYQLERIIKHDTSLCYTLFNYINSAYFGLKDEITSIRHAMVLLGESEVRKWASLVLFTFMGQDKPAEVTVASLIRARMCEMLASHAGLTGCESELFVVGMFSMLDVLIGRPLREILDSMRLTNDVRNTLLGMKSKYSEVFDLVVDYQAGNWEQFAKAAKKLLLDETMVPKFYLESVEWADQIVSLKDGPRT